METESVLIEISLDNLRNAAALVEEGFRHEYKKYDVKPLDIEEIKYISELGSSPLCTYLYLKSNEKKLIAKLFKVSDMEK